MSLRNRLVMSPMETMYGTPDGLPSERTRDYFAARAKGGVGLITVGATESTITTPRRRADFTWAPTRQSMPIGRWSRWCTSTAPRFSRKSCMPAPTGWGPSSTAWIPLAVGHPVLPDRRPSAAVTHEQLVEVFDLFKAAVRRAAEAGYDGIELHAAHGYMFLGSFLAPQRNRRTDDYRGDSVNGRIRSGAGGAGRHPVGDRSRTADHVAYLGLRTGARRSADVRNRPGGTVIGRSRGGCPMSAAA